MQKDPWTATKLEVIHNYIIVGAIKLMSVLRKLGACMDLASIGLSTSAQVKPGNETGMDLLTGHLDKYQRFLINP